ncbi:hypothetical protein ACXR2T_07705 [Leucobacter sp. HY1910]
MSNMNRQAAGTKQAGVSVGGQFAASQKTEASGAGLSGLTRPGINAMARERSIQRAQERRAQAQQVRQAAREHENRLFEHEAALLIKGHFPEAKHIALVRQYDWAAQAESHCWDFGGVEDGEGRQIDLSSVNGLARQLRGLTNNTRIDPMDKYYAKQDTNIEFGSSTRDTDEPRNFSEFDEIVRIDLDEAEQDSHVNLSRQFLDTDHLTEDGFDAALGAARDQLNFAATNGYSRRDMAEYIDSGFVLENGDELNEEQLAQITELASREYALNPPHDDVYNLEAARRDRAAVSAAQQLGLNIEQG